MEDQEKLHWKTVQMKVNDLIPYEHNPRFMNEKDAKDLSVSVSKFNLVEIPAINLDKKVVAGHMRLKIMQALGRGEELIDVRIPNRMLTDEEFKEYNVRSNKNTGSWDMDILANLYEKPQLIEFGFTDFDFGLINPKLKQGGKQKGQAAITYEIIFNNPEEKGKWLRFLEALKVEYPATQDEASRIIQYLIDHEPGAETT